LILSEQQTLIENAIEALPIKQRAAITLFYEDDVRQKEAAEILGINIKAFESLLGRAKAGLKEYISHHESRKRSA
jgi:RNA polymerase sigma-70 factor (ECF subfamily)